MHGIGMIVSSSFFLNIEMIFQVEKYDMIEKWGHKTVHQFRSKSDYACLLDFLFLNF